MRRLLLLAAVTFIATPAQAEWWEARTDHFIVYSEDTQAATRQFAEELERFDMSLRSLQNMKFDRAQSDSRRLTVCRSGDTDDIGRLAKSQGVAGFYIPQIAGSVAFTPAKAESSFGGSITSRRRDKRTDLDPKSVLLHEYTHHFMFQHFSAAYPSWYREGFAETAATLEFRPDGSFHVGNPPQYRSDMLFNNMVTLSAEQLLTNSDRPDIIDVLNQYSMGWLLNHYLSFEPSRRGQLTNYLRLVNSGSTSAAAARQAFGDLRKLDADLLRYKNSRRLGGADVKIANYTPPQVSLRKLTADEEAIMGVKLRSKSGVTRKMAGGVAADARAVAAKYPQSYAIQLALAEAEFDDRQFDRAEAAADRAMALRPDAVDPIIYKSLVLLERGKDDKKHLAAARSWAAKAYEADSDHAAPLLLNYLTYFYEGGAIPESALIGLERAFEFAPYSSDVRVVLTRQLLAEGKGKLARTVLMPLAVSPHEAKAFKKFREVVDLIDAQKVPEAHKMLATYIAEQEQKQKNGG